MSINVSVSIRTDSAIGMIVAEGVGGAMAAQIVLSGAPGSNLFAVSSDNLIVNADLGDEPRFVRCMTTTGSVVDVDIQAIEPVSEPDTPLPGDEE